MENKKVFFVIALAVVLALIVTLFIFKPNKVVETPNNKSVSDQEKIIKETPAIENKELEKEVVDTVQESVQKPTQTKKVETQALIIKPLKVEESKISESSKEEIRLEDPGIVKEADSNVIVITREFKSESPAKYSFK